MIGHVLKAFRNEHRISMREFAKRQGWSVATQCRIESGKPMGQRIILRLIEWLFEPNTPPKTVERWFTSYNKPITK
jgi:transcriptional regulator with XRE-family HTH domain